MTGYLPLSMQAATDARSATVAKSPSSVEIATDAKGNAKATVKVYHTDIVEALRLAVENYLSARTQLDTLE